ncbi:tigger transposable element-derived protein 6 [Plakobranchus ocellatus]|uniref:Tigger transposable element-derived protein 6 n=1 Tax=Plakobranchus ocellatus TaxID=259542 RepID=A0AAV4BHI7_9GAST|nr:tigger transposable element-derived protein 6 [Plakobranchus ocellatus]
MGSVVSQEKGTTVTMCGSINAIGNSMPPFLVFPRVNIQEHWTLTAPVGTACDAHPNASGWMTTQNFLRFLDHFKNYAKPSAESPVLLILDNHASHVSSEVIQFCKMNNITLLSFPPHCSHEMQPLDKLIFGVRTPSTQESKCPSTPYLSSLMVSYAFPKAFTPNNIIAGFRSTGIYPLDPNVFPDHKFAPTYSTDHPLLAQEQATSSNGPDQDINPSANPTSRTLLSPKDIRPLTRVGVRKEGIRKRKAVKSTILTLTPEKRPVMAARKNLETQALAPKTLVYSLDSDSEANDTLDKHLKTTDNDEIEDILTDNEEDELIALSSTLGKEVFRCEGKKSAVFYAGMIKESVDHEGDFEVEYLKRSDKQRNKFINFKHEEIWSVNRGQIIKKADKQRVQWNCQNQGWSCFQ